MTFASGGHRRLEHENCRLEHCGYCDGGLFTCAICGASEGELPKDCPGVKMTEQQRDDVMAGRLDYVGGQWKAT